MRKPDGNLFYELCSAVADSVIFPPLAAQAWPRGTACALFQQIAKLERELGITCFTSNSRGATLTEAGKEFVIRAGRSSAAPEALEGGNGLLRRPPQRQSDTWDYYQSVMYWISVICRPPSVRHHPGYLSQYPSGRHTIAWWTCCWKRKIDLLKQALTELPSSLDFAKLGEDYYSPGVPGLHPLAKRGIVSPSELKDEHFIFHQSGQVARSCLNACRQTPVSNRTSSAGPAAQPPVPIWSRAGWESLPPSEEFSPFPNGATELNWRNGIVKEVGIAWRSTVVTAFGCRSAVC